MVKQELTYSHCFFSFMRMVGNFDWDILVYPSKVFVSRFCYYLHKNFNYNNFLKQNLNSIIPTIFWRVISWWFRNSMIFECNIWKKWTNHYPPLFCFSQRKQLLPAKWVSWVSIAIVWSWWNHINGHKVHHVNHDYPVLSYETTNILIKPQKMVIFPITHCCATSPSDSCGGQRESSCAQEGSGTEGAGVEVHGAGTAFFSKLDRAWQNHTQNKKTSKDGLGYIAV